MRDIELQRDYPVWSRSRRRYICSVVLIVEELGQIYKRCNHKEIQQQSGFHVPVDAKDAA